MTPIQMFNMELLEVARHIELTYEDDDSSEFEDQETAQDDLKTTLDPQNIQQRPLTYTH